jgi:tRNA (guanine37-N1)-methyltransferase
MQVDVITLFPEMFAPMHSSMMWKAQDRAILQLQIHNLRDYSLDDKHRTVDGTPYGGGGGMVLRADVIANAVEQLTAPAGTPVIYLSPQGRVLSHQIALELSTLPRMVLLCGHYEGIDERALQLLVTDEISIGDYVLTGGELAAMVLIDAVIRQLPGVLGAEGGAARDSHADGLLEGAHYTRPQTFRDLSVPSVLQNGDHRAITQWRRQQALRRTWQRRPDLLLRAPLSEADRYFLATLAEEDAHADNGVPVQQ